MSFFEELKRRNVLKMALLYIVSSWLVLQVGDVLLPNLGAPDWAFKLVIGLLVLGFPLVLVFSWVFELTPEGLKRESAAERQAAGAEQGRRTNLLILVMLVLAIAVVIVDRLIPESQGPSGQPAAQAAGDPETADGNAPGSAAAISDYSIAVLPFADMSAGKDQAYLSDGIAEELLNLLAKIPELRVVSRTSAFSFKGKDLTVIELADRLGVAHMLEGSVRKSGDRVRITAQLIDARQDTNLWSGRWDRTLTDVFAIQDEIAASVAEALQLELLGQLPVTETTEPTAYSIYLQASHNAAKGTPENMRQAVDQYRAALAIDPGFVSAWTGLGVNFANLQSMRMISPGESHREILAAAQRVLELDRSNADGYSLLAYASEYGDGDYSAAVKYYHRALEIEPNNIRAMNGMAVTYRILGLVEQAIELQEQLLETDPLNASVFFNLGMSRVAADDFEGAVEEFDRALSISPKLLLAHVWLGIVDLLQGDARSSLDRFEKLSETTGDELFSYIGRAMTLPDLGDEAGGAAALAELESGWGRPFAYVIATIHAWQTRSDQAFFWLESALQNDGPAALANARGDPMLRPLHDDPRWQPLLEKAGLSDENVRAIPLSH
jgi:TolB-like protein/Tfp pilus assembly protein PilF